MKTCPKCGEKFLDDANFCPMDANKLVPLPATGGPRTSGGRAATPEPAGTPAGLVNGRFAPGPRLGGGRTGEVLRARDQQTGAQVVLKFIQPAVLPSPIAVERASRELRQLARVTSERVVRLIDFGKIADGRLFVASELVEGVPLDRLVAQEGPLVVPRARALAIQIGEALAEAQKVGVIHRDVSPKNVLVSAGDRARVMNFAIPLPVTDKIFGVPEFLSPEQAEGRTVDQRSNIYSLGAILYFLVTGQPPFAGDDPRSVCEQHLSQPPVAPSTRRPGLPPEVDRLVLKALEKTSSRRHLTLRQLLSEIEALPAAGAPALDAARAHTMFAAGAPSAPSAPAPAPSPAPSPAPPPRAPGPALGATMIAAPSPAGPMAAVAPAPPPAAPAPSASPAMAATLPPTPAAQVMAPQPAAPAPAAAPPSPRVTAQAGQIGGGQAATRTVQHGPPAGGPPPGAGGSPPNIAP
jgi:serine/threonine-protein kinase